MRRSEGVAAQEAPAITRKAGLLSDQKGPSRASNGTGKNAGLSSRMRVHFPTMEIRVQDVVGHPEPAGRKHRVAVAVLLERPRLAYQPVDDVAVLDAVFAPAAEPRQALDPADAEPDLQRFGPDVDVHPFADEPARHGIRVAADVDRAPRVDPRRDPAGHLQPPRRQRPERGPFLGEPLLTVGVAAGHDLAEEDLILTAVREIAAASQQEGLVDGLLEPVVALLD